LTIPHGSLLCNILYPERKPPSSFSQSKNTLPALCVFLIQADASYFRIDLPNSGMVILDKPLDYETKTQLHVVIYAVVRETPNSSHIMCSNGTRTKEERCLAVAV